MGRAGSDDRIMDICVLFNGLKYGSLLAEFLANALAFARFFFETVPRLVVLEI